ncbi:MAG TPA: zinc metalloprotease HtpX [Actinomycetes bacterium]
MSGRNYFKTTLLLATLSGLLLLVGQVLGGGRWLTIMLLVAIGINGLSYFFSDKIALRASRAQPVTEAQFPELYGIVNGLAVKANIPMPKLYVSPSPQPNAFATGRNPQHAAVAVTQGILPLLDRRELEGVLAHELSHVRNRDILISSVAATIGAVITWLAHLAWFLPIGGDDDDGNAIGSLLMLLLAPIAAMLIQLAVTRSREFGADASGANITADPLALASALRKIEAYSRGTPPATTNPSTAHLFISNPFKAGGGGFAMASLFSTHPPTSERVARLEAMAYGPRRYA